MALRRRMFALISNQGTAMDETALCEECFTPERKALVSMAAGLDENPGENWKDRTP